MTVDRRLATDGPGATGEWLVYLGETETHTRTAHGQTFELVVPERAALAESPGAVLGSLAAASNQVRVGDRDDRVFAVAAPTGRVDWGVRGAQFGERDMWVRDAERLDTPENTWLHEYVHSRQDYGTTAGTRWTTEAIATYYAALLPLEQGRIDADAFREHLRWGTRSPQADAVLSDPRTWYNAANYLKGMTVIGHLDREIRAATDGERSFQEVFSRSNARTGELENGRPERIDRAEFLGIVGNVSSAGVRADAERYATTDEAPAVWSAETHEAVFGTTPARISERFRSGGFSVEGPFRNGSPGEPPLTVYVGEEVTAVGEVTNAGDTATEYRSRIDADDEAVASDAAAIDPGETRTYEATHAFTEPGERSLTIGSETVSVRVRRPASVLVEDLSADRTRLDGPGTVALTATVTADGAGYASGAVAFTRDGDTVAHRNVTLGPDERRTVSATVPLESAGEYQLGAGEADPVVVTVADPDGGAGSEPTDDGEDPRTERSGDGATGSGGTTGSGGAETVASGPGFAPLVAVVALVAVALGLAIARER